MQWKGTVLPCGGVCSVRQCSSNLIVCGSNREVWSFFGKLVNRNSGHKFRPNTATNAPRLSMLALAFMGDTLHFQRVGLDPKRSALYFSDNKFV